MAFKNEQELRKYLTKKVKHDVSGVRGWMFNGIRFSNWSTYFGGDFSTYVGYSCDFKTLTVTLARTYSDLMNGCCMSEKVFTCGENCISECIDWVVERLIEVYTLLNERTAPYANNKALYDMMIRQPLKLNEGA